MQSIHMFSNRVHNHTIWFGHRRSLLSGVAMVRELRLARRRLQRTGWGRWHTAVGGGCARAESLVPVKQCAQVIGFLYSFTSSQYSPPKWEGQWALSHLLHYYTITAAPACLLILSALWILTASLLIQQEVCLKTLPVWLLVKSGSIYCQRESEHDTVH